MRMNVYGRIKILELINVRAVQLVVRSVIVAALTFNFLSSLHFLLSRLLLELHYESGSKRGEAGLSFVCPRRRREALSYLLYRVSPRLGTVP